MFTLYLRMADFSAYKNVLEDTDTISASGRTRYSK